MNGAPEPAPPAAAPGRSGRRGGAALLALSLAFGVAYALSNPRPAHVYDQTFLIAKRLLQGHLGVPEPRPWLELVPGVDEHYSVFPLGAVLSMLPVALGAQLGLYETFPVAAITGLQAAAIALLVWALSLRYPVPAGRRLLLVVYVLFGTWLWVNLAFGGAWQVSLGFAAIGQLGALCCLLVWYRPLAAGAFYALAVGNRTELLVVAPLFVALVLYAGTEGRSWRRRAAAAARFCLLPALLAAGTLAYNHARFGSVTDFGYMRIPYVRDEPGYQGGLMSAQALRLNADVMLLQPWRRVERFPYFVPNGFGESILLCSPYLVFLLRWRWRDPRVYAAGWAAVACITAALWAHGNPGGYQYGYRYAISLLPWICLLLLESAPPRQGTAARLLEAAVVALSVGINAYALYAFYWARWV